MLSTECIRFYLSVSHNKQLLYPWIALPVGSCNGNRLYSLWYRKLIFISLRYISGLMTVSWQEVGSRFFTAEAEVQFRISQWETLCGDRGNGTCFSSNTSLSISFHQCSKFILILILLLPEGYVGEAWESSNMQYSFGCRGAFEDTKISRCRSTLISLGVLSLFWP
jgi:hypothetical protein